MSRCQPILTRVHRYEPSRRFEKHAHEETQVTLFFCGQIEESVAGETASIRPLDVIVKPSGTEHTDQFGECEALSLQLSIPPTAARSLASLGNGLSQWQRRLSPVLVQGFLDLAEQLATRTEIAVGTLSPFVLRDLVKRLSFANLRHHEMPEWLREAMSILELEFCRAITVAELARRCDVHPVSLTRACRQAFGETISQRRSFLRAQRAAALLADDCNSLAGIAVDCGFVDQSHFNRVFKSVTGRSPGHFRRLTNRLAELTAN